jgi:hypothetical protein
MMKHQRANSQIPCMLDWVCIELLLYLYESEGDKLLRALGNEHLAHFMALWDAFIVNAPAEESNEADNECGLPSKCISYNPAAGRYTTYSSVSNLRSNIEYIPQPV